MDVYMMRVVVIDFKRGRDGCQGQRRTGKMYQDQRTRNPDEVKELLKLNFRGSEWE